MNKKSILQFTIIVGLVFIGWMPMQAQTSEEVEQQINDLIEQMTLEEKVSMIHANSSFTNGSVDRLNIPSLIMSDGPHGVRMEHGDDWEVDEGVDDDATYLPTGIALAATWNPDMGYKFGTVLGSEARERGKDIILGPGINVIRTPLNGRNFEYMSEDPYLISSMVDQYIKGVQEQDVAACVKHYIANNQEIERMSISVEMSERALREIYLPGFKSAVQEGEVLTVMGAYNKFRNQFATHNEYLNDVLKDELGFDGVLLSDWGSVHSTMEALMNRTDIEMGTDLGMLPNPDYSEFFMGDTVVTLVENGKVPEKVVDNKVRRILRVLYAVNKMGDEERKEGARNTEAHQQAALEIAEEGIVLLKNDNMLPLNESEIKDILVVGANADRPFAGRGGSSQVPALYEITPLQGLKDYLGDQVNVEYAKGYKVAEGQGADAEMIEEAKRKAEDADVVVYVGGFIHGFSDAWADNAYDAEDTDKPDMQLPFGQNQLIKELLEANSNTAIVMMGGGPVDMTGWIEQAPGIIQAWYPGMEGGTALANIMFGETNPSGKLPMTFPKKLEDAPAHSIGEYPGSKGVVRYFEGIFNGYRYYDTFDVAPQFPFGHGLSYTSFEYSDIEVSGGDNSATVSFTVRNTGERAGKETAQLYVGDPQSKVRRPLKELKGFEKVALGQGESTTVEIELSEEAFSYYDNMKQEWVFEPGEFKIYVGSSAGDIRLEDSVEL